MGPLKGQGYWDSTGRLIHPMARPKPAIAQRKRDPSSTQIIVLGRVVACRASLVVTSTSSGIVVLQRVSAPIRLSDALQTPILLIACLQIRGELTVLLL
jgi:hypothetical protein